MVIPKDEYIIQCQQNLIQINSNSQKIFVVFLIKFHAFRFSVSLFRSYLDNTWSSFKQDDHGINISYNVKKIKTFLHINKIYLFKLPLGIVPNAVHSFTWEGVWRSVLAASPTTSLDVRKDAGHTLKSSLKVCSLIINVFEIGLNLFSIQQLLIIAIIQLLLDVVPILKVLLN